MWSTIQNHKQNHEVTYHPGPPAQDGRNIFRHYLAGYPPNHPLWASYSNTPTVSDANGNLHMYFPGPRHFPGIRSELMLRNAASPCYGQWNPQPVYERDAINPKNGYLWTQPKGCCSWSHTLANIHIVSHTD